MNSYAYFVIKYFLFFNSAILRAGRIGRPCSISDTKMMLHKHLCSKQFLETDFTTAERIQLNRVAVPSVSDLTSHSAPQSSYWITGIMSVATNDTGIIRCKMSRRKWHHQQAHGDDQQRKPWSCRYMHMCEKYCV
jgi:hypothetical protein